MQAEMKVARRKLAKRKEVLATADQVLSSQDAEIKALRRQVIEAEVAHHQQERAYDELMQERDILGTQLIRRNDELALLYEKIRIQQSTLHKGEAQYRERLQDLRALKFAINGLKYELQRRIRDTTSAEALKTEITHMQRELLQERTKVRERLTVNYIPHFTPSPCTLSHIFSPLILPSFPFPFPPLFLTHSFIGKSLVRGIGEPNECASLEKP